VILDASALVSIILKEEEHESLLQRAERAEITFVGTPTAMEAAMVLSARLRCDARPLIAGLLYRLRTEFVDFNQTHYEAAVSAFLRFGKGRHPAALNFGDCMSYATSRMSGMPLLYSGKDFSRTDVRSA